MAHLIYCPRSHDYDRKVDMTTELPDNSIQLLQRIANGDREAFPQLYDRYAPLVFTFATRLLRVRSDAEDLLQEVFLQVWRQAQSYQQDRGSPEAWIIMITRSRAIDKLRSLRRRDESTVPSQDSSQLDGRTTPEGGTAASEARLTVDSALSRLPESQRIVIELAYFDGLTQSEIAARVGEPLGTVKTRLRVGLRRLREFLGTRTTGGPL